jgi:heat-inducible transcriptional repressor
MRFDPTYESRQSEVLTAILRHHIGTGLPVGSKSIASEVSGDFSPATIRNVMAKLEFEGFLSQPHTSAGRVPTEKAYRFYVERIKGNGRLAPSIVKFIETRLRADGDPPEDLMARVSHILSEVSNSVGLALGPGFEEKLLEHIKLVKLAESRVLAVLVSRHDFVENKVVRLEEDVSQEDLDRASQYLNGEFRGWSLRAIRMEISKRAEEARSVFDALLRSLSRLLDEGVLGDDRPGRLFVEGTSKILNQPEFEDATKIRELLAAFEEKAKLIKILESCLQSADGSVQVLIGKENPADEMRECALVIAPLRYRSRVVGALGMVGPIRMEYDRTVPTVDFVAHLCSRMLDVD